MKLYSFPGTAGFVPNFAIAWTGAPIDIVCMKRGEHKEEAYLAINPKGQVPALVIEEGDVLTETLAILDYIDAIHGGHIRSPFKRDTKLGRKEAEALSYLSSTIHATFRCHFAPHLFAKGAKNEKATRHIAYWRLDAMFDKLDEDMSKEDGPWMLSQKSYADAYLYIIGRWIERTPMDISDYPNLLNHKQEMEKDENILLALQQQNMEPANYSGDEEEE